MAIYTKRLMIRALSVANDYAAYAALTALPEVSAGAGFDLISNPRMMPSALKRQLRAPGSYGLFKDDELIGAILLFERIGQSGQASEQHAEISYFLAPSAWHCGYMVEALMALIEELQQRQVIKTIVAEAFSDNQASINLLKRLGFSFVTELRDPIIGRQKVVYELVLSPIRG